MSFIKNYFAPKESKAIVDYRKSRFIPATDFPQDIPKIITPESTQDGDSGSGNENEKADELESPKTRYPSALGIPSDSPWQSRPGSQMYPPGDFRNNDKDELRDIKCDVMVNWLYQQQMEMLWTAGAADEGVVLKKTRGSYTCCPADIMEEPYGFFKSIEMLNVRVSIPVQGQLIDQR